jgi:hypothetical protein
METDHGRHELLLRDREWNQHMIMLISTSMRMNSSQIKTLIYTKQKQEYHGKEKNFGF